LKTISNYIKQGMNSLTEIEQMHVFTSFPEDAQDEEKNEVSIRV
jgi:hypothetical protein